MKGIIGLVALSAAVYLGWTFDFNWYFHKQPEYEFFAERIPKDNDYIAKYFVQSCSGPYCNFTHEWQGGGVTGLNVAKKAETSSGTATLINKEGHWLTARHVVDGCTRIKLRTTPNKEIYARKVRLHPEKDLALLYTDPVDLPYLKVAHHSPSQYTNGYVSGFPAGRGAVLYLNLLGSNRYRHANANTDEYTFIWSIESGLDSHKGTLFGFSGSSVLNRNGEIVSIMQGYSSAYSRNNATATSTLASIHELISDIPSIEENRDGAEQLRLSTNTFFKEGNNLRKQSSIVLVICEAES